MTFSNKVLVVDDDREVAADHARLLRDIGYNPIMQSVPEDVEPHLQREPAISLVLLDIRMPGLDGLELLQRIRLRRPDIGVVMATVINDVESAVRAIHAGAYNYLLKPLQKDQVEQVLRSYFANVPASLSDDPRFRPLITGYPGFREIFRRIKLFGEQDIPVLILGETGTGKEIVAQLIHSLSRRSDRRFLKANVAAIPTSLFESELFGHARGAFTGALQDRCGYFEAAGDGTLFLDEIGELGAEQQSRLLRVLQDQRYFRVGESTERTSSARIVLATNRNLASEVKAGRFREDLYYRIANYSITLPPLRERGNDIEVLANYFVQKYASQFGHPVAGFSDEAMEVLKRYPFPGNVRELEGIVSSTVLLEEGGRIVKASFSEELLKVVEGGSDPERARFHSIQEALKECDGNQTHAAKRLGIARQTLSELLRTYRERGWL